MNVAGSLHADSITIDKISGNWSNPVGGGGTVSITPGVTSQDIDEIRWGTGTNQSGYDWDATNTSGRKFHTYKRYGLLSPE